MKTKEQQLNALRLQSAEALEKNDLPKHIDLENKIEDLQSKKSGKKR